MDGYCAPWSSRFTPRHGTQEKRPVRSSGGGLTMLWNCFLAATTARDAGVYLGGLVAVDKYQELFEVSAVSLLHVLNL